MNEGDFQTKLSDLLSQLETLPGPARDQIERLAHETRERHARMRKTVGELQDSLDYLRLSIKYLVFDLEATRRENVYLRKLLERQGHAHGGGDEGLSGGDHGQGESPEGGEDEPMPGLE